MITNDLCDGRTNWNRWLDGKIDGLNTVYVTQEQKASALRIALKKVLDDGMSADVLDAGYIEALQEAIVNFSKTDTVYNAVEILGIAKAADIALQEAIVNHSVTSDAQAKTFLIEWLGTNADRNKSELFEKIDDETAKRTALKTALENAIIEGDSSTLLNANTNAAGLAQDAKNFASELDDILKLVAERKDLDNSAEILGCATEADAALEAEIRAGRIGAEDKQSAINFLRNWLKEKFIDIKEEIKNEAKGEALEAEPRYIGLLKPYGNDGDAIPVNLINETYRNDTTGTWQPYHAGDWFTWGGNAPQTLDDVILKKRQCLYV